MSENKREYANSIRDALRCAVAQVEANPVNVHIPTPGQRGAVIGIISKLSGGDDNRRLLLGWLFANEGETFNKVSTKTLNDAQWAALYAWCDFRKDEEQLVWKPKDSFTKECLACLSAAMDDFFNVQYSEQTDLPQPPEIVAVAASLGGEITYTGVKNAGIKGVPDSTFFTDEQLPEVDTPPEPYVSAMTGNKIDVQKVLDSMDLKDETPEELDLPKPALKEVFKQKPKLYNPFD